MIKGTFLELFTLLLLSGNKIQDKEINTHNNLGGNHYDNHNQ